MRRQRKVGPFVERTVFTQSDRFTRIFPTCTEDPTTAMQGEPLLQSCAARTGKGRDRRPVGIIASDLIVLERLHCRAREADASGVARNRGSPDPHSCSRT